MAGELEDGQRSLQPHDSVQHTQKEQKCTTVDQVRVQKQMGAMPEQCWQVLVQVMVEKK